MDFVAAKKDFSQALSKVQSIPESKNLSSVMANLLLESVDDSTVKLTAQSYDVTMVVSFPAQVLTPGKLALSARMLTESVKMAPEAPISVKAQPNYWADFSAGRLEYSIPGILPDNMPQAQTPNPKFEVTLPSSLLTEIAERVGFAMSQDEGRPNLNGISLRASNEDGKVKFEAVATDSHRLAKLVRMVELEQGLEDQVKSILHRKGISELKRFLDDSDEEVVLGFERSSVAIKSSSGYLLVRQVELEYPDYNRVIPNQFKWQYKVERAAFIEAVRQAQVVISADKTPLVRINLSSGKLVVSARDPDRGNAVVEIDVDYDGEPLEVSYNNRYLLDALTSLTGREVLVSVRDQDAASILSNPEDGGLLQLIMPVRP